MKNKHNEEVIHLTNHLAKHTIHSEKKNSNEIDYKLFLLILALLSILGEEAVKILFRKNFGIDGLSIIKLILNVLIFAGLGTWLIYLSNSTGSFATKTGTSDTHFAGGIFYFIIAITVLIKGILHFSHAKKTDNFSDYTGDSDLLSFLKKEWDQPTIQYAFEPLLLVGLGTAITLFDRVAGLPLIFCAISVWLSFLVRKQMFGETMQATLSKLNEKVDHDSNNEVN